MLFVVGAVHFNVALPVGGGGFEFEPDPEPELVVEPDPVLEAEPVFELEPLPLLVATLVGEAFEAAVEPAGCDPPEPQAERNSATAARPQIAFNDFTTKPPPGRTRAN